MLREGFLYDTKIIFFRGKYSLMTKSIHVGIRGENYLDGVCLETLGNHSYQPDHCSFASHIVPLYSTYGEC